MIFGAGFIFFSTWTWNLLNDGLKIVKLAAAIGRFAGLPLPECEMLPAALVTKAELQAVDAIEAILKAQTGLGEQSAVVKKKGLKAATGKAYKALRKLLDEQCEDKYLVHCPLKKVRAEDGTIEFVSAETKERFVREGAKSLVWNHLTAAVVQAEVEWQSEAMSDDETRVAKLSSKAESLMQLHDYVSGSLFAQS